MPAVSPAAAAAITEPVDSPVPETLSGTAVKAPIVGTFYSKPRPDSSPFVTVGSKVKKGDVLYILETMKVMNEITSEYDGIVSKILAADGDSLEYGQTVMIIS
jgi:acetyl-CoA carboxylase biotin carboxyl carrier protein